MEETVGRTRSSIIEEWVKTGELPEEIIQIAKVSKEAERELRRRALELSLCIVPEGYSHSTGLYTDTVVKKTAKELIDDAGVILNYIKNGA